MARRQALVFVTLTLVLFALPAPAQLRVGETIDARVESPHPVGEGPWRQEIRIPGATFLKLHASRLELDMDDLLLLTDGAGREVLSKVGPLSGDLWLPAVDGEAATVEIWPARGSRAWGIGLDQVGVGHQRVFEYGTPESICGVDDRREPACYDEAKRTAADAVGRMLFPAGRAWYLCTGTLVSPDSHFLTNNHCVSTQASADALEVRWRYQRSGCGTGTVSTDSTTTGATLLLTDYTLDFSLLRLNSPNPAFEYGFGCLESRKAVKGEVIWIPQHGGGDPKTFAVNSDLDGGGSARIVTASVRGNGAATDVGYYADTEGGSSGSPVFDADNKILALHHFGTGSMICGGRSTNQGVKMSLIYPRIAPYLLNCTCMSPDIGTVNYVPGEKKLIVKGTNFTRTTTATVNGSPLTTVYKSETKLQVKGVPKIPRGGSASIQVTDSQSGCTSNTYTYTRP